MARTQKILGVAFDLIDYEEVMDTIRRWRQAGEQKYISIANPHSVLLCHRDERMAYATAEAALTLPDGVGIIMAANILGYKNHGRVTGPNLILHLCDCSRDLNFRHFFYGGAEGVAEKLARNLTDKFPGLKVVGTYCPPFRSLTELEDKEIVDRVNAAEPDIVWVGLGAPKQEKWMLDHLGCINATAMIGVGAAFDFHSGNVKWAPTWVRKLGLEWAYRTSLEPARIGPKAIDNLLFGVQVLRFFIKQKIKNHL